MYVLNTPCSHDDKLKSLRLVLGGRPRGVFQTRSLEVACFCHLVFLNWPFWMLQDAPVSVKKQEDLDKAIAASLQVSEVGALVTQIP